MASKNDVVWTIRELVAELRKRQLNKFDANLGVSGKRGDGKSTLLFKIFNAFKNQGFIQEEHQVYAQDDVIELLATQKFGYCWDDEAINSGYKRDFQQTGQKELIKVVTNYRDNHNIYGSALPFFYSLDKDLRELIFLHIHIVERGIAVLLMPLENQIHTGDQWDTAYNIKIEQQENLRIQRNPDLKFRYSRFSTFAGWLYFGDMTKKQRERYERIKSEKREARFNIQAKKEDKKDFIDKIMDLLLQGKLSQEGLAQACLLENKKYSSVCDIINRKLRDSGDTNTLKHYLRQSKDTLIHNSNTSEISKLVPDFST